MMDAGAVIVAIVYGGACSCWVVYLNRKGRYK